MNLSKSQIESITLGAAEILQTDAGLCFRRFTQEQMEMYAQRNKEYYLRARSASGIQLRFCTNSTKMLFSAVISRGSSRSRFVLEVYVNGKRIGLIGNHENGSVPAAYDAIELPLGAFSKEFDLGEGEKEVCIYLPWSAMVELQELCLDDGAWFEPVKPGKKLLCFGDSITQGYDTLYPSAKYATQLAKLLDAEERNKGVGGEIYFPELAKTKEDYDPDYITVAYGSNDWNKSDLATFRSNCTQFFENLCENYPNARIYVITPIWRSDCETPHKVGEFALLEQVIRTVTAPYAHITVIPGFDLVAHDENYFADRRLHPNDEGFRCYFENLTKYFAT